MCLLALDCIALFWKGGRTEIQMANYHPVKALQKKKKKKGREKGGRGSGLGGGVGGGRRKTSEKKKKKKNPQQAIRLIFSQPGLWVHCLVFAGAQAVCPGGATF